MGVSTLSAMRCDAKSFDHVVREHEEIVRHFETERPSGGKIDGEVEFDRLLDRDIAGLSATQILFAASADLQVCGG
jgi:hypothetical protein